MWAGVLKNDPKIIFTASARAQKAVNWILGDRESKEDENPACNLAA
jgi:antirestriction protein ArdC